MILRLGWIDERGLLSTRRTTSQPTAGQFERRTECPTTTCTGVLGHQRHRGRTLIGTKTYQQPLHLLAPAADAQTRARTRFVVPDPRDARHAGKAAALTCLEQPRVQCASVRDCPRPPPMVPGWSGVLALQRGRRPEPGLRLSKGRGIHTTISEGPDYEQRSGTLTGRVDGRQGRLPHLGGRAWAGLGESGRGCG